MGEAGEMRTPLLDGIDKHARLSFSKLRNLFPSKHKPLFHMVSDANVPGFIRKAKVTSPIESLLRGGLKTVEGGMGTKRYEVSQNLLKDIVKLKRSRATIDTDDIVRYVMGQNPKPLVPSLANRLVRSGIKGKVGRYNQMTLLNRFASHGPSKNWSTISLSTGKPLKEYGGIGVMVDPKKVRYPFIPSKRGGEMAIISKATIDKGALKTLILPQVKGQLVYDPQYVMERFGRETARALKNRGAIPLNAGFFRRMKALNRHRVEFQPRSLEPGNMPWRRFEARFPEAATSGYQRMNDYVQRIAEESTGVL